MKTRTADAFAQFAVLVGLLSGAPIVAQAADLNGLNINLNTLEPSYLSAPNNPQSEDPPPIADYFAHWSDRVDQARAVSEAFQEYVLDDFLC